MSSPDTPPVFQRCVSPRCGATLPMEDTSFRCPTCGGLMDVAYDWNRLPTPKHLSEFEAKWSRRTTPVDFSGVWRFRELLPFAQTSQILTIGEGQTILQKADVLAQKLGMRPDSLHLQYEGMNPSGSFKDNGMTAAFTHARITGARRAACASTGNTSASLASYCSATGLMRGIVFIGSGKISYGKLAQALDHHALTMQIAGDFDDAMARVQQVARRLGVYLVNSINPFRLEGQKTIMLRVLEALAWEPPDWIIVPGGNLGNSSAFGKAYMELKDLGLVKRIPRLAVINAAGARTFDTLVNEKNIRWNQGNPDSAAIDTFFKDLDAHDGRANTIASAIEINRPVNLVKALRAIEVMNGIVRRADDQEIMDAKALIGAHGLGCEPASAASLAGLIQLREQRIIAPSDRVVCILTAHQMKDPTATVAYHSADQEQFQKVLGVRGVKRASHANRAVQVPNDLEAICGAIELYA